MKRLLTALFLITLAACGYHPPAPIAEHSASEVKRLQNADGTYTVSAGDTLYAIAFSYGLDHRDVAAWNGIASPYIIYPGQNLQLSPPATTVNRKRGKSSGVQISGIKTPRAATARVGASSSRRSVIVKTTPPAKKSASRAPGVKHTATHGAADPENWKWPVNGRVLRGYVAGDPSRNGLDIAGIEGQPVRASSAGKVVYSGNGLIGYGELIIIKHSEKMLSAYAHNKVRLVQEGEQVSAGQKIAEMGRNDQNEELLHFEIRTYGKPVNPLVYLPKR